MQAERLPELNPQINYNFDKDTVPRPNTEGTSSAGGLPRSGTKGTQKTTQRGEPELTDYYGPPVSLPCSENELTTG